MTRLMRGARVWPLLRLLVRRMRLRLLLRLRLLVLMLLVLVLLVLVLRLLRLLIRKARRSGMLLYLTGRWALLHQMGSMLCHGQPCQPAYFS